MRLLKTSMGWCFLLCALTAIPLAAQGEDHGEDHRGKDVAILQSQSRHANGYAIALRGQANQQKAVKRFAILVDTSASQVGSARETTLSLVKEVLRQLPGDSAVELLAVDVQCEPLTSDFVRPNSGEMQAAVEELTLRTPLGATNLKSALTYLHEHASTQQPTSVLYIGDGLSASQTFSLDDVQLVVRRLNSADIAIHSAVVGPRTNTDLPAILANLTGGTFSQVGADTRTASTKLVAAVQQAPTFITGLKADNETLSLLVDQKIPVRSDRHTIVFGRGQLTTFRTLSSIDGRLNYSREQCERTTNVAALPKLVQLAGPLGINVPYASLDMLENGCEQYAQKVEKIGQAEKLLARRGEHLQARRMRAMLTAMQVEDLPPPPDAGDGGNPFGDDAVQPPAVEPAVVEPVAVDPADVQPPIAPPNGGAVVEPVVPGNQEFVPDGFGGQPQPPSDPLDSVADTIKLQTQILVAETNQAIDEANRVSFDQPEYAINLLKSTLEAIESSADISPDIRVELSRRVRSGIAAVQNRRATNELIAKQRARDIAVESAQKKVIAQQIEDEKRMANLIDQVRGLLQRGREGDRNAFENAESVSRDALALKPGSGPATQALVMSEALGQLDKAYQLVNLRHDRFLEVLYQVELSHVPFPDEPPIQYPPADVWRALTLTRKPRYESFDLRQEKPVEKWLRQMLDKPVPRLDYPGDAPLSEILDEISQYFNTTYGELEGKPLRMTIYEDTAEFELEGINSLEDVTVRDVQFQGITLRNALKLIFEKTTEPALTYIIDDEVFKITTLAKAESDDNLVTRVYPVADLVIPPIQLGSQGGGFGGGGGGRGGQQGGGGFGGGGGGFGGGGGQQGGFGGGGGQFSLPPEVLNVLQDANAGINNQNVKKKPILN